MTPRQTRRERREAERKAKKLELKKARQASGAWSSAMENRQASAPPLPGINSRSRLAEDHPLAAPEAQRARTRSAKQESGSPSLPTERLTPGASCADFSETYPEIQPRWNPELEDEFPREVQIRQNAILDLRDLKAGRPIPPPGPTPGPFSSLEEMRQYYLAKRTASPPTATPHESAPEIGFVSHKRAQTNRANAQLSTGPTTPKGKLASSRNSTKHGLASGTVIIPGEDQSAFEALLNDFLEEHRPATPTEEALIQEIAQSLWLTQRAIRLQNECFTAEGINEKQLALFLRYQTTHDRRFHKALDTLLRLKKIGFVSQRSSKPAVQIGFVSQEDTETLSDPRFVSQNPFDQLKKLPSEPPNATRAA